MIVLVVLAYRATTIPTEVSETALQQSSNVYFSNGKTMIGTFSTGTNRQLLTSAEIPPVLKNAVIAAEDRHFYTEGGVSPTGILRAAYEDLRGGGTLQGGSTITQQFVRNYYANIGTQQTMSRKIKEIFVAIKLSHTESKDWILTQYLNTVYLGDSAYGVGAAAQIYFNKPASKLNVAQSAMLAAMINEPGYFSPDPHAGQPYQALLARWHYVLTNMVRDGSITQQQAAAQKFPKIAPGQRDNGWTGYRGYIMQAVESELENTYGFTKQQIYTRGLRIVTTFNQSTMTALYRAVAQEKQQMKADGQAAPWYVHIGAVLEKPGTGAIVAMYGGPGYGTRHCLRYSCEYNMAMQSSNQVGSSFKPYVLATAVAQGMNVQNSVLNGYSPIWIPPDWNETDRLTLSAQSPPANPYGYWEFNEPNENSGPLNVPKAAAISSDPAFEDLTHRVGVQNVLDMARNLGVAPKEMTGLESQFGPHGTNAGSVTVSLGQGDLTVEDQANTFAVLASGGQYATPHVIAQLVRGGQPDPIEDRAPPGDDTGAGGRRGLRAVLRQRPGRYRVSGGRVGPVDHRQDRDHEQSPVGVLHRVDTAVLAGRRDVHAEPVRPHQPDARRPADAGWPERRRIRRRLAGDDLARLHGEPVRPAARGPAADPGLHRLHQVGSGDAAAPAQEGAPEPRPVLRPGPPSPHFRWPVPESESEPEPEPDVLVLSGAGTAMRVHEPDAARPAARAGPAGRGDGAAGSAR